MSNKIILNLAISLDGFIADENGGYDWIQPAGNSVLNTNMQWHHDKFLEHVSAVIMGKNCYDQKMHTAYPDKQIYIITSKKLDDYDNIHFINKNIIETICLLKKSLKGDIYLFGGGITIDKILKAGIIDEYIIGIVPIILGKGIPLFLSNNPKIPLYLANYFIEDGITVLHYLLRNK